MHAGAFRSHRVGPRSEVHTLDAHGPSLSLEGTHYASPYEGMLRGFSWSSAAGLPLTNLIDIELTQCRSSVSLCFSPKKTCPRWPARARGTTAARQTAGRHATDRSLGRTAAIPTGDLDTLQAVRCVERHVHTAHVALVERRPSAAAVKLGLGRVERVLASAAHKVALLRAREVPVVLAATCGLGTLAADDRVLLGRQLRLPFVHRLLQRGRHLRLLLEVRDDLPHKKSAPARIDSRLG
eukprot:2687446-Prymnesium_polylepis.1